MLRSDSVSVGSETAIGEQQRGQEESGWSSMKQLLIDEGPWWGGSFAVHMLLLTMLALLSGMMPVSPRDAEVEFATVGTITNPGADLLEDFDRSDFVLPSETVQSQQAEHADFQKIDFQSMAQSDLENPTTVPADSVRGDDHDSRSPLADSKPPPDGSLGFAMWGVGPAAARRAAVHSAAGEVAGNGGKLGSFRMRGAIGPPGMRIPVCERRVAAALSWFARHQLSDGRWSLQDYTTRCRDMTCSGPGAARADTAATAMAILPFLATGRTHMAKGPYQKTIADGLAWLIRQQKSNGDLRGGSTMYAHGLAAIALCEVYGMTGDHRIGTAAQLAIDFLQSAQNKRTGGWRYEPGDEGDLSVGGWQIMALKSAQMAGLKVDGGVFRRARDYLNATSSGQGGSQAGSAGRGLFAYQPGVPPTKAMTAVGLLCSQYLGAGRDDPAILSGTAYLMANLPEASRRDLYYWYYATQVLHNQPGSEWDTWNRKIREMLVESQQRESCAAGSWDAQLPSPDPWGAQGGRLMATSLATLTLEVYYRYIPLYTLDAGSESKSQRGN
jgi:hypothetical protein